MMAKRENCESMINEHLLYVGGPRTALSVLGHQSSKNMFGVVPHASLFPRLLLAFGLYALPVAELRLDTILSKLCIVAHAPHSPGKQTPCIGFY